MTRPAVEWCTGSEAARLLGVSRSTITREIRRSRTVAGVPVVVINNTPRISRAALLAVLTPTTERNAS